VVVFFVSVIFPAKQKHWSWRCSFIVPCFQTTKKNLIETGTQDSLSELWPLFLHYSNLIKQLRSLQRSSIVLSFRAGEIIFIGNRTQDSFSGLWPSFV
jgi:hypothetical protein